MKPLILILCLLAAYIETFAQYKEPDSTKFGSNGYLVFSEDSMDIRPSEVVQLNDGNLLVFCYKNQSKFGGWMNSRVQFRKISPDGQPIKSYGNNGILEMGSTRASGNYAGSAVKLKDGKIIALVKLDGASYFYRLDEHGGIDPGFGTNGRRSVPNSGRIALSPDNKLWVLSYSRINDTLWNVLERFNIDGSPDLGFATNGKKIFKISNYSFELYGGLIVQNDGKVCIPISLYYGHMAYMTTSMVRLMPNGDLDQSFGNGGKLIIPFELEDGYGEIRDFYRCADGSYIIAGNAFFANGTGGFNGSKPTLAKILPEGKLDSNFSDNGIVTFNSTFTNANDAIYCAALLSDNTVLFGGSASLPFPDMYSKTRITAVNNQGTESIHYFSQGTYFSAVDSSRTTVPYLMREYGGYLYVFAIFYQQQFNAYHTLLYRFRNLSFSTAELSFDKQLKIFPNPTAGQLHIMVDKELSEVKLFSATGSMVLTIKDIYSKNLTIDTDHLSPGIYFIHGKSKNNSAYHGRFLKE